MPESCCWFASALLFAQDAGSGAGNGLTGMFTVMLPAFVALYFLVLLPQQRQERRRRKMIDSLKKNDRVLTAAGIYGVVASVDSSQDRVVIRVDDEKGIKLTVTKSSVSQVLTTDQDKDKGKE
jgi:preprotein translocase subunit YajC